MSNNQQSGEPANAGSVARLVGRSLPSAKHGAWIVNEIRGTRARLVTADLRGEQTVNVDILRMMLAEVDSSNAKCSHGGTPLADTTGLQISED